MRVFVAAPFTSFFGPLATAAQEDVAALGEVLNHLGMVLEAAGHTVFMAHRRESFGSSIWPAEACTPFDFLEMSLCDAVVAIPGASYGVHLELGWAAALRKPSLIILERESGPMTPLLVGLSTISASRILAVPCGFGKERILLNEVCESIVKELAIIACGALAEHLFAVLSDDSRNEAVFAASTVATLLRQSGGRVEVHHFGCELKHQEAFQRTFVMDFGSDYVVQELKKHLGKYRAVFLIGCSLNVSVIRNVAPLYSVSLSQGTGSGDSEDALRGGALVERATELVAQYVLGSESAFS